MYKRQYIIYSLTTLELDGTPLQVHSIWLASWRRFETKALAKQASLNITMLRAESRGDNPPNLARWNVPITPLAEFSEQGQLIWNKILKDKLISLSTYTPAHRKKLPR